MRRAGCAPLDFGAFLETVQRPPPDHDEVFVISVEGKGIVMRPGGLRPLTAARAATARTELKGRLSRGESANRERMAEVGAVYTVKPVPRAPRSRSLSPLTRWPEAHRSSTHTSAPHSR